MERVLWREGERIPENAWRGSLGEREREETQDCMERVPWREGERGLKTAWRGSVPMTRKQRRHVAAGGHLGEGDDDAAWPAHTTRKADGDRNAERSKANKSSADRRVTGDPPCSSPRRSAASTQTLESTDNHKPCFIKHRTGFCLLGFISDALTTSLAAHKTRKADVCWPWRRAVQHKRRCACRRRRGWRFAGASRRRCAS
jgi:hypothetical protein